MASHGANNVFLSFRGEDTRHCFTDHLYAALKRAGISTFRDEEEIKTGEKLKPDIERIIKESRASVVVLSKHYATSTWCLDELALILEQRRKYNHFVLPVFYQVDPSDVRKQNKSFAIQVKAASRWTDENVNMWKKALTEVADLKGMESSGYESKFLKKIVDTIYDELDCKEVHLPTNITGMAARYGEISSWLALPGVEFLAICGMGGSGKTTLAKYIYNSNRRSYENTSFVEDIGRICEGADGLRMLQKQLLEDILGGRKRKIPSVSEGTCKIEEALLTKRSLIVLDDISEDNQFVALLGTGKIHAESKIIITTRKNTEGWFKSTNWSCKDYKMESLKDDESLELLSRHAFGSKKPMEGFKEVAERAVRYCDGNPMALEVLASALSQENTVSHWKSLLNQLEKELPSEIQNVLEMSYKSLSLRSEKELFLHIACFFVGIDKDYVEKILEPDCSAISGIKTLSNRCLLSVSPKNKLIMHRLLQEMGKNIVCQESKLPAERSRVWLSDSYKILSKGEGSETMEGLALDMQMLAEQKFAFKSSNLKTDALQKMDNLKLLQLNLVQLSGSYENFPEDLRWLCWLGSNLRTIPSELFMGNLVAVDLSYSKLKVFEPPMVLQSLQILNLTDSHNLFEIRNISMMPQLETLILWNCHSLARVCETIGDLTSLALLNMTGCENLCKSEQTEASTSGGEVAEQPTFSFPRSLHRLFLKDCNLDCTDSFPLSFSVQLSLQYLNLGNGLFEFLPCYDHLKSLRVLDLSFCSMLKRLVCLPSTLAELYIYYCISLEEISFQSHRFALQEFGYEGCISLSEIEGFIKLVHVAKLEENDLGHLKWLKEYQNLEVCLVGDDELTKGRSACVQMLYEFNIMSTSLPNMEDPNMKPMYVSSELSSLSFDVPPPPENRKLKGIDVTFKYTVSGDDDDDMVWFCKINTSSGTVDLMYNPHVFGKPEFGEVGIWLSYWPIGNTLATGDKVRVSIAVISGLEVHECGASLVYTDNELDKETVEDNMTLVEALGGDLSGFQLSTEKYYLCRRDFFELMEVGRLTPDWFSILVGDTMDCTEVRGWRKTGRPMQFNPSFTELKFVRCIMHGPESEEIYNITSSLLGEKMKSSTSSIFMETTIKTADRVPMMKDDKIKGRVVLHKKNVNDLGASVRDHMKVDDLSASVRDHMDVNDLSASVLDHMDGDDLGASVHDHMDVNDLSASVLDHMDFDDLGASVLDIEHELSGQNISFQLISAIHPDHESSDGRLRGKLGTPAILEEADVYITHEVIFEWNKVSFEWNDAIGVPGAILVKNHYHKEVYIGTLTLEDVPGHGPVHFVCNSWVYPSQHYTKHRIFFANKAYLPVETPELLRPYREEELVILRGKGYGELRVLDRVYDYALYNDLGDPDYDVDDARPVLGGSSQYPYPRRGRTGRPPTRSDFKTESRLPFIDNSMIYVPRDECLGKLKPFNFLSFGLKSLGPFLASKLTDSAYDEFDSFDDLLKVYEGGIRLPLIEELREYIPYELWRMITQTDGEGERLLKLPMPQAIKGDKSAWRTDEEFAREMLAGVNPVSIRRLEEFPPTSKLDPKIYGNQNSSIEPSHIEKKLDGLELEEALKSNRLFILDHHDSLMPYVRRINATSNKIYATRTLLFLQKDGTLKPLAIELSLPHEGGDHLGAISKVFTPAEHGVESSIWQLAKAYVAVNDSGVHQLISHWLNTHCVIEPFVIATNRQLSVLHPIHKLLQPHFKDTMNINALARQMLINGGGLLEATVFPGRYAMEMSSALYKDWVFPDQALPADLLKRGMAVEDSYCPHGLRLLIEDYPYAVDGLEIWFAIKTWVEDYCSYYYQSDYMIQEDPELQSWWKELREQGHGDKKHEAWWPIMQTRHDLIDTCTTIIWIASALHAAVNFGQYTYAGYLPNRPTLSRRLMPEPHTPEYDELIENPENVFLKTVTAQLQSLIGIALIEILSRHPSDEVYLGQIESPNWTKDLEALNAFEKFGMRLREIEGRIVQRNNDGSLKNRVGPVKVPYTLLYPSSEEGLTGRGIPNSVSI